MQGLNAMTEEKSVTFTAREIADALEYWAWRTRAITIPGDARLNLTSHTIYGPASATLTWKAENKN
jgi:hypothetical protein